MSDRKASQRYLSGRSKVIGFSGLSSDRHLYIAPGEVEPNLGYPGEKTLPLSETYYRLVTIPNGTVYDRYWQLAPPAELVAGISIFDEGILVGTANSVSKINFVGVSVTATASGSISTITIDPKARVFVDSNPPSGAEQGDLWWDSDVGELYLYYEDGDSNQWVETSGGSETVTISDDPPTGANSGDLWWESDTGVLHIYYNDGDSAQWVDANAGILDNIFNYWTGTGAGIHTLGKVGIGTTNPTDTLTVLGNINVIGVATFTGNVTIGGTLIYEDVVNIDSIGIVTARSGIVVSSGGINAAGVVTALGGFNIGIQSGGVNVTTGVITALNFIGSGNTFSYNPSTKIIDISISSGSPVTVSDTPPVNPENGDLWWESDTGDLKVYYTDGTSAQWVSANSADSLVQISSTAPSNSQSGDLWWNDNTGDLLVYYDDGTSAQWVSANNANQQYWIKNNTGIHTLGNVGVGTTNSRYTLEVGAVGTSGTSLWVNGDARITGILTIGTSSITLDGSNNQINVGSGVTLYGNTGIISATNFYAHKFYIDGVEAVGPQGSVGSQGIQGSIGAQGSQGIQGSQGRQGSIGAQGSQGIQGTIGSQGVQGTIGAQGSQGVQGSIGAQGVQGAVGSGSQGVQGTVGTQGVQGSIGFQGVQGAIGSPSDVIPSGSVFLLYQANAPTGWTKVTTQNNKALRVVSGTGGVAGGTGGTFSAVFASRTPAGSVSVSGSTSGGSIANTTVTGSVSGSNSGGSVSNTTLSTSEMPSHTHSPTVAGSFLIDSGGGGGQGFAGGGTLVQLSATTTSTGGNGAHGHGFTNPSWSGSVSMNAHSHTFTNPSWSGSASFSGSAMDFAVQFIDIILCSKD